MTRTPSSLRSRAVLVVATSIPILWLRSTCVLAQTEDVDSAFGGAASISLATGYTKPLFDAPVSATVVQRRDIEDSGARNLGELLQTVTSYYVVSPDGGRSTSLAVRGLESRVLILVDNVPLYAGLYNGTIGYQDIPLDNVERVEITRGPGSALYGADAVAGVVNIITRTSMADTPREIGVRGGTLQTAGGYGIYGADVGGLHLALYGGYNQSAQTDQSLQADAQTGYDKLFHTHASLAPGPINDGAKSVDSRVEVSGEYWRARATWHNDYDLGDGSGTAGALDPNGRLNNQVGNLELVYKRQVSSAWDVSGYLVYTDVEQAQNLTLYPPGAFGDRFPSGVREIGAADDQRMRGEGTGIYASGDNRLLVSAGGFTDDARTTTDIRNYIVIDGVVIPTGHFAPGAGVGSPLLIGDRNDNVVYTVVQDEWAFARDFSLTAGTRMDYYNHYHAQWSPRVSLVWSPNTRATWKLLYNEAFRPPSIIETQSDGTFAPLGNPDLAPSKTRMAELDFGYRFDAVEVTASGFAYQTNNLGVTIIDKAAPIGLAYVNGAFDRASGFDGEAKWHVLKTLTIDLNGMYQSHNRTSETYYIAESPPGKLVNLTIDWAFVSNWNLYVSGSGVFDQGRASTDLRPDPPNYGLLNFSLRTTALPSGIVATLRATNALNKYYVQPSQSASALPYDVPQPGRVIALQVTKSLQ